MKLMFILFLFSLLPINQALAIDTGDGTDGACITATFLIAPTRRIYQCATLNFDANLNITGAGGTPLIIKVQGDVLLGFGFTVDLSGINGIDGDNSSHFGGAAGAGGGAGGNSQVGPLDGLSGNGSGAGALGKYVADTGGPISYGGGGGGGSYKTKSLTIALDGLDGTGTPVAGTLGLNGNNFVVSESQFDTSFSGGSGGGAGGGGKNTGVLKSGSSGGGGGGAIRIVSGGNIVIDGTFTSNGGNGGGTIGTPTSGGGGGASGGAIWLQAAGTLTVSATGTMTALGGTGGTNDLGGGGGDGGQGGNGGIRLDAGGAITTAGSTINPAVGYSTTFSPSASTSGISAISREYASGIACGRISLENELPFNNFYNLILGMLIASAIYFSLSRKGKI